FRLIDENYLPRRVAFSGMSSFFCMTIAPPVRDEEPIERAPPPLSSSPFPTGLLHRAWVGLWNGFFAHDLPLNFRSGVQLGDPRSGYNWKISFQAPTSTALASPLARLDRKFRCDFNLRLCCSRRRQKNRDSTDNRSLTY